MTKSRAAAPGTTAAAGRQLSVRPSRTNSSSTRATAAEPAIVHQAAGYEPVRSTMSPKTGGPRKMPTLKNAAETPAAAPAERSAAGLAGQGAHQAAPADGAEPEQEQRAPQQPRVAGLEQRERDAREPGQRAHAEQRRHAAAAERAVADEPAQRLAEGAGELAEGQHAGGHGHAVAPVAVQEEHEVGERGELDDAEEERREPHHPDVARAQHGGEPAPQHVAVGALVAGHRRQPLVDLGHRHGRLRRPRRLTRPRVAVEEHGDHADDEGEAGGEDEPGLPAVGHRQPRHDGGAQHAADVDGRLVDAHGRRPLVGREPQHDRLDGRRVDEPAPEAGGAEQQEHGAVARRQRHGADAEAGDDGADEQGAAHADAVHQPAGEDQGRRVRDGGRAGQAADLGVAQVERVLEERRQRPHAQTREKDDEVRGPHHAQGDEAVAREARRGCAGRARGGRGGRDWYGGVHRADSIGSARRGPAQRRPVAEPRLGSGPLDRLRYLCDITSVSQQGGRATTRAGRDPPARPPGGGSHVSGPEDPDPGA